MATVREMTRLSDARADILKIIKLEPKWKTEVGRLREDMVSKVLSKMKEKKEIADFLSSGNLSSTDIFDGIDFYVVVIDKEYKSIPISVTGPDLVEAHRKRHLDVPIVAVKLSSTQEEIREKIFDIINSSF